MKFKIFREKPGVISKDAVWCIIHDGYLYIGESWIGVLFRFLFEYKSDHNLLG